ncbi:zinc finger CCHC domain-containing protein 8 homolog isoform X1 [Euwallacea fornicatus]|uniref:zinc finger CCHC domain-containing protein 8 homolog isoform X1 n=1 Tax=Euwallacea fornicatus TaxID=995702 RepID=UPI00338E505D
MSASMKRGRKRKSAGVCDIFEVEEKDLSSSEPEELNVGAPDAKIQKIHVESDISEVRENDEDMSTSTTQENEEENKADNNVFEPRLKEKSLGNSECVVMLEKLSSEVINLTEEDSSAISEEDSLIIIDEVSTSQDNNSEIVDLTGHSIDLGTISSRNSSVDVILSGKEVDTGTESLKIPISNENRSVNINTLEDGEVNDESDVGSLDQEPAITIKFRDKLIADIYKQKFINYIQTFIELNPIVDNMIVKVFRDDTVILKEWVVLDDRQKIPEQTEETELVKLLPATPKHDSPRKKKKRNKLQSVPDLFVVDTKPAHGTNKPLLTKYNAKFSIDGENPGEGTNSNSKPSSGSLCFNCEQDHSIKDCPFPKNHAKINANRQKFQSRNKSSRYHLEEDQKFAHMKPGQISTTLRKALGLKKHEIPPYVYQMRMLGYPPGWLEEAKYVLSDLAMFDIDGNSVGNANTKQIQGLDPEKVVDYPGFNVPFEKNFKDEYKYYQVPPFCDNFSKQNMIDFFNKMVQKETQDMETHNEVDFVEEQNGIEAKQADSSLGSDSYNDPAISLQELEKQKVTLLEEIKKTGETLPWNQPSHDRNRLNVDESTADCGEVNENLQDESVDRENRVDFMENAEISAEETADVTVSETLENSLVISTPSTAESLKCSIFGTPIIKSCSLYNKLPCADNFMKGVSPVIDFENLPNSTGKYEKMTNVLRRVRDTLKDLQK